MPENHPSKILAFLQNMWFKEPELWRKKFEHAESRGRRNELIARLLFYRCLTGRRLRTVFGDELCDSIIWEEASRHIGGQSSAAFPADPAHMLEAIQKHQPDVVLCFGAIAFGGMTSVLTLPAASSWSGRVIGGPHPAARGAGTLPALRQMLADLDESGMKNVVTAIGLGR